jgi:superfamily II DNA or RNA helicase
MLNLRPYQQDASKAVIDAFNRGLQRVLVAMPTGTGKTVTFGSVHELYQEPGQTLVVAHRDELIEQAAAMFRWADPAAKVGIEKANQYAAPSCSVVVSSIQTLARGQRLSWMHPKLIVPDEAHHAVAPSWVKVFDRFGCFTLGGPKLLGVTATPKRLDRLNLQSVFEEQVYTYPIRQAIEEGWLLDIRGYRVRSDVNLDKVHSTAGDFNKGELADAVKDPERTRRALSHWYGKAKDRKTLVFCADVEHAELVAAEINAKLNSRGVFAACVHGELKTPERRQHLADFKAGKLQILTNAELLTEGYDEPEVGCILMLRPTQSWGLYCQMLGRGTRTLKGTIDGLEDAEARVNAITESALPDLIVIDVVDNCRRHSLAGVPCVLDLPPSLDLEGETLTKAAKFIDQLGEVAAILTQENLPDTFSGLQTLLEQVDLFAQVEPPQEVKEHCSLAWVRLNAEHYFVECGSLQTHYGQKRAAAHLRQDLLGRWVLQLLEDQAVVSGTTYEAELEPALEQADAFVRTWWPSVTRVAGQNAPWRRDPPTAGQLKLLQERGYDEQALAKLNKGQASSLISALMQRG